MRQSIDFVNQNPEAEPSAEALFEAVHAVMHRFRALQFREQREADSGLTHMEGKVLGFFGHHPGATQKELAGHMERDKGQLARLIAGLRERGLLEGKPDEADRRNVRLQLTPEGRSRLQAMRRRGRRVSELGAATLSADERRQLAALLHKLYEALVERP